MSIPVTDSSIGSFVNRGLKWHLSKEGIQGGISFL